jgi:hypothetical protein
MLPTSTINQPSPPILLVKTWCQLLRCEDEEASARGKEMLLNSFGDMQNFIRFLEQNNIRF